MVTLSPGRAPAVRRSLAGLLAAATVIASAALGAAPASAAEPVQVGLFGTQDPTYDGVFRQSLSLLAFVSAGEEPPAEAVAWLLDQQCADGGFQAYRSDTSAPCTESDPVNYVGEDSNSTALASAALTVLGELDAADAALGWLESAQNADGGFPYFLGGTSDVNSTAIALLATNAVGLSPSQVTNGSASAADYLTSLQVGCPGAATDEDGGFAYADFSAGTANDSATVQAALAITGAALPFVADPPSLDIPRADCPAPAAAPAATTEAPAAAAAAVDLTPAELAGGYIARTLTAYDNAIPELDFGTGLRKPGTVSAGDTAWAVLALSAIGVGGDQRDAALDVLLGQVGGGSARKAAAASVSDEAPGLLALAALAVVSADGSQATVEGLVARVGATMRTAPASSSPTPSPTGSTEPTPSPTDAGGLAPSGASPLTPGLAGSGALLVLLGAAALLVSRRQGSHA
ncbi:prenyltransferase/squalene oxidase repeat-containing protein [Longivirga aurantiaca]|uniref:Prenyltransferase alpha-alpha toroid domain-containing protein n=1 Tax=Longivirga aurantiaca TaxID=1837743 RepID=A0ABW1T3G1_9ACTN